MPFYTNHTTAFKLYYLHIPQLDFWHFHSHATIYAIFPQQYNSYSTSFFMSFRSIYNLAFLDLAFLIFTFSSPSIFAGKFVPGCYTLAVSESLPEDLQVYIFPIKVQSIMTFIFFYNRTYPALFLISVGFKIRKPLFHRLV